MDPTLCQLSTDASFKPITELLQNGYVPEIPLIEESPGDDAKFVSDQPKQGFRREDHNCFLDRRASDISLLGEEGGGCYLSITSG